MSPAVAAPEPLRRFSRVRLVVAALALLGGGPTGCAWLSGYDGDDYALAGGGAGGSAAGGAGGSAAGGHGGAGGLGGGGAGGMLSGGGGSGGAVSCAPNLKPGLAKIVFVLRARTTGDLDGILEADLRCQEAAEECLGGRTWLAFLSTEDELASDRLSVSMPGPWVRPDGQLVFSGVDALDEEPSVPINLDQRGRLLPSPGPVWTGTSFGEATGHAKSEFRCNEWSNPNSGAMGEVIDSDGPWTTTYPLLCDELAHLYCFETK